MSLFRQAQRAVLGGVVMIAPVSCNGIPEGHTGATNQQVVGSCSAQQYVVGAYAPGDEVQNLGSLYRCKPWPTSGWCGIANAYQPGVGSAWRDAWDLLGSCDHTDSEGNTGTGASDDSNSCAAATYVNRQAYAQGAQVANEGHLYRCKISGWCSLGDAYAPGSGWAWPEAWELIGGCSAEGTIGNPDGGEEGSGSPDVPERCDDVPEWRAGTTYVTGAVVMYGGQAYIATHDNPGYDPTISTWYWSSYDGCAPGNDAGSGGETGGSPDAGGNDAGAGSDATGGTPTGKLFVGYYQTWSDAWKANGADTVLARLPNYVNVVNLAFMQPNANYVAGSMSLGGTGIGVPYDGPTLKDAIAALHRANPATKVMISVGGATFTNWSSFNAPAIAAFARDFGLDGVDIDYEPSNPNCALSGQQIRCPSSDTEYVSVINTMRSALPRPYLLSIAAWSVGAYGEGSWSSAPPAGSAYTGIALAVFKNPSASAALDLVNVMSYDASSAYNPREALQAYQHYFKGKIAMGIEVPPEAWGGHVYTISEIDSLADAVNSSGAAGLMLWSIQKAGPAQQFATEICTKLGLGNCSVSML